MNKIFKYTFFAFAFACLVSLFWNSNAMKSGFRFRERSNRAAFLPLVPKKQSPPANYSLELNKFIEAVADTGKDTTALPFPFKDRSGEGDPLYDKYTSGLTLGDPTNIDTKVDYDTKTGNYVVSQKMGGLQYRPTTYMTLEEYKQYDMEQSMKKYWKTKNEAANFNKSKALIPKINVGGEIFDRIFGGNTVDIRPQGTAELIFALNTARNANPAIPQKQRKVTTFDFNQKIQLNVVGKIGDKMKITTSYNTEATFDFENQMKLDYTGYDDEIIQKIEAGNVSLPLSGSLITGSQSLFGIKTSLKFGRLTSTTVFSQSKGQKKEVTIPPGGGQLNYFTINGDNYEANKHYFLSQYFRDNYDKALANLPFINSGVNITRIEVWVTNRTYDINNRNICGFMDLGEDIGHVYNTPGMIQAGAAGVNVPDNTANNLYATLTNQAVNADVRDFNKINNASGLGKYASIKNFTLAKDYDITVAKKLQPSDFTYNAKLGYISLNQSLNADEVLAVAYQYTLDGKTYQVGEFSTDGIDAPKVLYLKLLKATLTNVKLPTWDLMMKNVYSLGAFQIQKDDFKLDIVRTDNNKGVDFNFIPEGPVKGSPLVRVMGFDRLNRQLDPQPDGMFDIVEGITINLEKGRIYFPSIEPFGTYLQNKIVAGNPSENAAIAKKYVFQALYDSTKFAAQQLPELNRYKIRGSYKSSSGADISLNALNIPQGSVTVTCGGVVLTENVDYTVDYAMGRVKIINEGILNSGNAIKASFENNTMFSIQQKSLIGNRFDYRVNKDFNLGATILHANERPLTQKVNLGDEPISNTIYGFDGNYRTEAPWLTRLVDKLPLISTKEMSTLSVQGEFAQLLPGHSKAVGKEGTSYIDDFEGSQSVIDIKNQANWVMASIPQGQYDLFNEARFTDSLISGYNRAKTAWYIIDPLFFRNNNLTPTHIKNNIAMQSNAYMREVIETEIFPNRQFATGQQLSNMPVLDFAFYPKERGQYNYNYNGLNYNGTFTDPKKSWGGIMRRLETTDFENSNIQYIQFWVMDPFIEDDYKEATGETSLPSSGGQLFFNLGDVSEDILKDNRMAFENGLPVNDNNTVDNTDTTNWGIVPSTQVVVNAFDNDPASRKYQDIGMDGVRTEKEAAFYATYLNQLKTIYGDTSTVYKKALEDASTDDYHFYRGDDYDQLELNVLQRYKKYNGMEGNSKITESSDPYPTQATTVPNVEDINKDNTLNRNEGYYQYSVRLDPGSMEVGQNYITNKVLGTGKTKDGKSITTYWYQFRIPVREPEKVIGNIQDFRSIRFMRMFVKGFDKPVILRFGKLELVRGEWRKYNNTQFAPGEYLGDNDDFNNTLFNIAAVNYEEHGQRVPINYVLPPGIQRQRQANSPTVQQLNEQALSFKVCGLKDGDERAAFRTLEMDMRMYKKLRMFVHAEKSVREDEMREGDLTCYVRLGTDFNQNYYEYELPLKFTDWEAKAASDIWPDANNIILPFEELQNAKIKRNQLYRASGGDTTKQTPYVMEYTVEQDGIEVKRKITVVGNPNLASVKVIMVGVRNPKKATRSDNDDGLAKCAEVWINELRLTDFDDLAGWAALTRVNAKLADLGSVTAAANYTTPGFGSVDQKLNDRTKETTFKYDLTGAMEAGKFFPKGWNLRVPVFANFSEQYVIPRFSPLEPDIEYRKAIKDYDKVQRDSIREYTLDYTKRRGFNFTNVKKDKGKNATKTHLYDIENLSATYAYNETFHRDINIEYNTLKTYKAALAYNYSANPKNFKPLANVKMFKSDKFKIIKDFNYTLMPSRIGARVDLDRNYQENQNRNNTDYVQLVTPTFNKNFLMTRSYDYAHDLAKSLQFTYNAANSSRIDEPGGRWYKPGKNESDTAVINQYEHYRDSLKNSILKGGRNTGFHQTFSLNYTLPFNKIPVFNWVTGTVKYTANYDWAASPLGTRDSSGNNTLGNTIQNSNTKQYNATLNTVQLFNKIPYFKKITSPPKPVPKKAEIDKKIKLYTDSISRNEKAILKMEKRIVKLKRNKEKEAVNLTQDSIKVRNKINRQLTSKIDSLNDELKRNEPNKFLATVTKAILSVKNISGSYTENNGTMLPGYLHNTYMLGMNDVFNAPGWDFIAGRQDTNFARRAGQNGWLTKSEALNNQFTMTNSKNMSLRATVEPYKDLKIDLTANKTTSNSRAEFYRYSSAEGDWVGQSLLETGNYSISTITIKTAFKKDEKQTYRSSVFEQFLNNRNDISRRLGEKNPNSGQDTSGFYSGYYKTSQEVLIPAFLSAYSGKPTSTVGLTPFPAIPLPGWRVTYDGLMKLEKFKKHFKNFTLSHGYKSTYSVGSFTSNLYYTEDGNGFANSRDNNGNFQVEKVMTGISVQESFSPLINADMTWANSLITKVELKRDRNLNLNFANVQLTEVRGNEIAVGTGYRFKDVEIPLKFNGTKKLLKSDLNVRADVSVRKNTTIIRKSADGSNQLTAGQNVVTIKTSADYVINERLNIRLFFDKVINSPYVSTSFRTSNANSGISIRFTLSQ